METSPSPSPKPSLLYHQISVLLLTFSAYASFHASRKPPSIVKPALAPDPSTNSPGWSPFGGASGPHRLGELDLAFLSSYSVGMYLAGHAADRLNLRRFLALGMLLSGLSTIAFGLGFFFGIHRLAFFMAVQIAGGLVQSIGWPCVVSVVGNWFGKSRRGLIMGVWNSHTSFGNILGSVLASSVLEFGWGWSFVIPGVLIIVVGFFVLGFLVVDPRDAGFELEVPVMEVEMSDGVADLGNGEEVGLLEDGVKLDSAPAKAIGFVEAWRLPGVAPFAFCLFFSKLVAYTFLYWLPFYIRHTAVAGQQLSHKTAGMLSTIFDVGGVLGGISAGFISDRLDARAVTSIIFLVCSIPALVIYRIYGSISMYFNISLMFLSGYFVNGPYALITTAVAADLGTQDSIKGNSRALATVTAIIDGTGSVGAALGPLLTGYISTNGWDSVFLMLILSTSLAIMFLIHLAKAEIQAK
ncbi:putative glycerol-3-phosphate transporter 5 [Dioscorea cayenensis subsp. rotundata]|uniref:Glycerol-3-phosphate transporter 5 n=1 Tax=Dioscorea cayennensis subsp. rotundata TaxID=55577 RepID=A0AB40B226_DIOCR|nr:putative glycerol-3-phosphate transporter 5 [Dioscorea cayenensis subsp. rotundata]